jgi:hypothetical protein
LTRSRDASLGAVIVFVGCGCGCGDRRRRVVPAPPHSPPRARTSSRARATRTRPRDICTSFGARARAVASLFASRDVVEHRRTTENGHSGTVGRRSATIETTPGRGAISTATRRSDVFALDVCRRDVSASQSLARVGPHGGLQ